MPKYRKGMMLATARPLVVSHAIVDRGITRRALSKTVGVSPGYGSEILAGQRRCPVDVADRYAKELGQPTSILFTIEEEAAPAKPRRSKKPRAEQLLLPTTPATPPAPRDAA